MKFQTPRGTRDILYPEVEYKNYIFEKSRELFKIYGFKEIVTPTFEQTEVFTKGIGEASDIVSKEMYTFKDRKGRSLTLKPEGTAPVVRSFIQNKMYGKPLPIKLFYCSQMFRYERPQAGRSREFSQVGVEILGTIDPLADVEVISLVINLYKELGITQTKLFINSMGCRNCRRDYLKDLVNFLKIRSKKLCKDCNFRIKKNPLRVFDCKNENCKQILADSPTLKDYICSECKEHFEKVLKGLKSLNISYQLNDRLVRGFDYYTKTVFEVTTPELGAQDAICGGGRYDYLIEDYGGPPTFAVGVAIGVDRTANVMMNMSIKPFPEKNIEVFIITINDELKEKASILLDKLRGNKISSDMDYCNRSLKGQFRMADRLKVKYVLILGEKELADNKVSLKEMETGQQLHINYDNVINYMKDKINVR
ncbi:MAG: histidine--tRNA ligase [Actinomycetia bacterium]|nr:histidine--tRNA ligase [Actinomycetes bacterium]